jgi:serine/threonine-protein kinase HipA
MRERGDYLEVRWGEEPVGFLTSAPKGRRGRMRFEYTESWLDEARRPISLSLPCTERSFNAEVSTGYFENLLPEGDVYRRLCADSNIIEGDIYSFLRVFGRECAGALSIFDPAFVGPQFSQSYKDITDDLEEMLDDAGKRGGGIILNADARLSIAGAQDKLPVHLEKDRYLVPDATSNSFAPTSAILKPPSNLYPDIHFNEALCMALAGKIGLAVPETRVVSFGSKQALLVNRYDREVTETGIRRLHQEDFCQALGVSSRRKYESDGGPGFEDCSALLMNPAVASVASEREKFVICAVLNYIIGNCDAHAKNFSLLYSPGRRAGLAPFYDLLSTRVYPKLKANYAMAIGKTFRFDRISEHSWIQFAKSFSLRIEGLYPLMLETAEQIRKHVQFVIAEQEAAYGPAPVYKILLGVIEEGLERVEKTAKSLQKSAKPGYADASVRREESERT